MPTLGRIILELREAKKLSQRELARRSKVSLTSLNLVEGGKQEKFNAGGLEKIAEVLDTTAAEIRRRVAGDEVPSGMTAIYVDPATARDFFAFADAADKSPSAAMAILLDRARIAANLPPLSTPGGKAAAIYGTGDQITFPESATPPPAAEAPAASRPRRTAKRHR